MFYILEYSHFVACSVHKLNNTILYRIYLCLPATQYTGMGLTVCSAL